MATYKVNLYVHVEEDLLRTLLLPAARRENPKARPPVLTERQLALWEVMAGLTAAENYSGLVHDHVWSRRGTFHHMVRVPEGGKKMDQTSIVETMTRRCLDIPLLKLVECWRQGEDCHRVIATFSIE